MNELAQLQQQFQQFILSGRVGIDESIVQTKSVSVEKRLEIYKDAYKLRLIECLTVSFPAVHAYLGTKAFEEACSGYIDTYPSTYRSIRWFGDGLAEFLNNYYDKKYSFLAELADFEWKMTLAFDAADSKIVQIVDMASVLPESWAGMQFTFHPSIHRLNYFWNAIPLWQTLVKDEDLPELHQEDKTTSWVLWRAPDYVNQFYSLSEQEAWALDALMDGLTFGQVCEGLCQWMPAEEVGMGAASYLKNWIQSGMVSTLHILE
ncbi:HvfC/BufC N-terminal domain-containing protein [Legionella fallonii]|uniref:Putative DNA-binding domain-containing protein n=1 Tax=Legionella fallonii LLAP-10 TaxID=1212491 RepID=A0A098G8X9_9GAMM|nr:DNA-binding domain-containing protein [Legionella fallonii]CEG58454.1 conserved protein of unknown function [Legionella fallonii LLAP-10]